jgi:fused signal recognition particle receptor
MFGALKKKLKNVVSSISKKAEEEAEVIEEKVVEAPKAEKKVKVKKETKKEVKELLQEEPKEAKSFLSKLKKKIVTSKISEDKFDDLFWELELVLLENNVAIEVIEKIKEDLKQELINKEINRSKISNIIEDTLKQSIDEILSFEIPDILKADKKPQVICFIGINGSGKTTTIAKVANKILKNKKSCVIAAADTFRAAAIEQIKEWGDKLNVKVIAHENGSDPAAVAYDAIEYAKAHKIDFVLIDTAGRLHSSANLMRELEKIIRVAKPDLKIFIGESITGNDCVEQADKFNKQVTIDGIILSKADIDEKGGTALSIAYITKSPILYLGIGQELDDLEPFNKEKVIKGLGL